MRPETKQLRTISYALLFCGVLSLIFAFAVPLETVAFAYSLVFTGVLLGLGLGGMVGVLKMVRGRKSEEKLQAQKVTN